MSGPVVACVQWVDLRPEIDPLHATVLADERRHGFSDADRAAVETALRLGERWGGEVWIVSAAAASADPALVELASSGADRVVRVDGVADDASAARVAAALGHVCADASVVVCGDAGLIGGSGAVPAMLAHRLGVTQALGLVEVSLGEDGGLRVVRRVDGGRRERLAVATPCVLSTEGSVATLRRGSLAGVVGAAGGPDVVDAGVAPVERTPVVTSTSWWRPRPRHLPPPAAEDPRARILALTGALVDRTPPRRVELPPGEAAEAILDQLRAWGYLE